MAMLEQAADIILKKCMGLKPGESILIITDRNKLSIADVVYKQAMDISDKARLMKIPVSERHGAEPSQEAADEMKKYDVIIIITTKSLSHTKARRDAAAKGARIASMPGITKEIMKRCIDIDYQKLKQTHDKLRSILIKSKEIRITTSLGTDVVTAVHSVHGESAGLYHKKGEWGNLPAGEVDSGVKEGRTDGIIIVDACFAGVGRLESPITLEVKDGYAVNITGKDSNQLKELLDPIGKPAYKIAELGIGTNPKADVTGNILEDEKAKATVHFALGNDLYYDGKNDVSIHLDGIITKPTVFADRRIIIKHGKFLF